jgi:hypothetical protein
LRSGTDHATLREGKGATRHGAGRHRRRIRFEMGGKRI